MALSASALMAQFKDCKKYEKILSKVKILTLENGKCKAELKLEDEHTNFMGGLHGGLSATLVDSISTYALMSDKKNNVPNVSVDIHMTYIKGAGIGEKIVIDAKTTKAGRTLAFLEVLILNEKGDLLVKGLHTKFLKR